MQSKFTQKDSEGNEVRNQVMYATNGYNFNIDPDFNFNKYMKDKYENTEKFMNEKMQAEEVEEFLRIE